MHKIAGLYQIAGQGVKAPSESFAFRMSNYEFLVSLYFASGVEGFFRDL
jgi:hypothetical protein